MQLALGLTDSAETVRYGHVYHFPLFPMIYQIKLQYGFLVDASDQTDAYNKAIRMLRENPSSQISGVYQASAPKRKTSLLMRIIKGV